MWTAGTGSAEASVGASTGTGVAGSGTYASSDEYPAFRSGDDAEVEVEDDVGSPRAPTVERKEHDLSTERRIHADTGSGSSSGAGQGGEHQRVDQAREDDDQDNNSANAGDGGDIVQRPPMAQGHGASKRHIHGGTSGRRVGGRCSTDQARALRHRQRKQPVVTDFCWGGGGVVPSVSSSRRAAGVGGYGSTPTIGADRDVVRAFLSEIPESYRAPLCARDVLRCLGTAVECEALEANGSSACAPKAVYRATGTNPNHAVNDGEYVEYERCTVSGRARGVFVDQRPAAVFPAEVSRDLRRREWKARVRRDVAVRLQHASDASGTPVTTRRSMWQLGGSSSSGGSDALSVPIVTLASSRRSWKDRLFGGRSHSVSGGRRVDQRPKRNLWKRIRRWKGSMRLSVSLILAIVVIYIIGIVLANLHQGSGPETLNSFIFVGCVITQLAGVEFGLGRSTMGVVFSLVMSIFAVFFGAALMAVNVENGLQSRATFYAVMTVLQLISLVSLVSVYRVVIRVDFLRMEALVRSRPMPSLLNALRKARIRRSILDAYDEEAWKDSFTLIVLDKFFLRRPVLWLVNRLKGRNTALVDEYGLPLFPTSAEAAAVDAERRRLRLRDLRTQGHPASVPPWMPSSQDPTSTSEPGTDGDVDDADASRLVSPKFMRDGSQLSEAVTDERRRRRKRHARAERKWKKMQQRIAEVRCKLIRSVEKLARVISPCESELNVPARFRLAHDPNRVLRRLYRMMDVVRRENDIYSADGRMGLHAAKPVASIEIRMDDTSELHGGTRTSVGARLFGGNATVEEGPSPKSEPLERAEDEMNMQEVSLSPHSSRAEPELFSTSDVDANLRGEVSMGTDHGLSSQGGVDEGDDDDDDSDGQEGATVAVREARLKEAVREQSRLAFADGAERMHMLEALPLTTCMICGRTFVDAVVAMDGESYCRLCIESFLEVYGRSPVSGEPIAGNLIVNNAIRSLDAPA